MSSTPIRNIYYMLAYVYRPLNKSDYKKVSAEEFDDILALEPDMIVTCASQNAACADFHTHFILL